VIVIDASALTELLVAGTPRAVRIATRIQRETLHAPHLIDLELVSALRSLEARQVLSTAEATKATFDLLAVTITRYAHDAFIPRIWQLRSNMTAYDAVYIALAEALGAPLVTCDAKLAGAPGHRVKIELFA
jgi:predicted nucleic acid-binding protein